MKCDELLLLLDYNYWATDRVVAAAKRANEDELIVYLRQLQIDEDRT